MPPVKVAGFYIGQEWLHEGPVRVEMVGVAAEVRNSLRAPTLSSSSVEAPKQVTSRSYMARRGTVAVEKMTINKNNKTIRVVPAMSAQKN